MRAPGTPTMSGRARPVDVAQSHVGDQAGTEKIATATRLEATADLIGTLAAR